MAQSLVPADTIVTVAGNGQWGFSGDGNQAVATQLAGPQAVAIDAKGNIYIADTGGNRIRKVTTDGIINTVAGNGSYGYTSDEVPAITTRLANPMGIQVDSTGNIYFSDFGNNRIRKITTDGVIHTIAGNGTWGYSGDGQQATDAQLNNPTAIAFDKGGNLYITDYANHRVRKVTPAGIISTVAGDGNYGYSGDGGLATSAELRYPDGVAVDSAGNVYIADRSNNVVRKVNNAGIISTFVGDGTGYSQYSGDYGPCGSARLSSPVGLLIDAAGNLIIADEENRRIRKVTPAGIIYTIAGGGFNGLQEYVQATATTLDDPHQIALDASGNLYIADSGANRIRRIQLTEQAVKVGQTTAAVPFTFALPSSGVALGSVQVLTQGVAGKDFKLTTTGTTCAAGIYTANKSCTVNVSFKPSAPGERGGAVVLFDAAKPPAIVDELVLGANGTAPAAAFGPGVLSTVAGNGTLGYGGDSGQATSAEIGYPHGLAFDGGGNFYIADTYNNRIRRVAPDGTIITIAGIGTAGSDGDSGPASGARLNGPQAVAVDRAGNLFIADTQNNAVREVALNGQISTYAGGGYADFGGDGGWARYARLNTPSGLTFDRHGNLYIADYGNSRVRVVNAGGTIFTIAGNGTYGYSGDNSLATNAELSTVNGLTVDSKDNLYIADTANNRIRKVTPAGIISTFAGNGIAGFSGDGASATKAALNSPFGLTMDAADNLYVSDSKGNRVRRITPGGIISTVAGSGTQGFGGDGGAPALAKFYAPGGLAVDPSGNLYIADQSNHRVRKLAVSSPPSLVFDKTNVGAQSPAKSVTVENLGNAALTISQISTASNFALDSSPSTACKTSAQTLASAQTCTLNLTFTPQASGTIAGSVVLTDNHLNAVNAKQTISLAGSTPAQAAMPVFSVKSGTYSSPFNLTITDATAGAVIYYTVNGAIPTASSTKYTGPFNVSTTETVQALAVATGYSASPVAIVNISFAKPAATPAFSVAAGTYGYAPLVIISDATAGAVIHYTTDGSVPTVNSTTYTGPILVSSSETLRAMASAPGSTDSAAVSAAYTIVGSPAVLASPATAVTVSGATLHAFVNTGGLSGAYVFQYGLSSTAPSTSTASTNLSAGTTTLSLAKTITGLQTKTVYYFRIQVTTAAGVSSGAILSFKTN